jgi:hypothetical protein
MVNLHQPMTPTAPRLRMVFSSGPVALAMPAGATLGDIADWAEDVARLKGSLLAVDVRMASRRRP